MSSPGERSLEDVVVDCLERMETEGERALDAVLREHPEHADQIRERIAKLRETGLLALAQSGRDGEFPERLGDFRLVRRLGEGGMGVVFLAEQLSLGRTVALKVVRPENLFFSGARERFRREVEAVARLAHPGIVPIHTVGEDSGIPYYAMEHLEGVPLSEVIAAFQGREVEKLSGSDLKVHLQSRRRAGDSSASGERLRFDGTWVECCLAIVREVAIALQHAHDRGVLHRDVKPSNVMLTPSGRVLLFDFGLASLQGSERLTRSGARLGSLAYMAPEQIEGQAEAIGPATDVYALGVTLHEILTLRLPFQGGSAEEIVRRILEAEPEPLRRHNRAVPRDVETIVSKALDPDPARRYPSADALARDLTNVLERRPIEARRASALVRARRFVERHPGWSATIVLSAAMLVGVPLLYALKEREARIGIATQRDVAEANLKSAFEAVDVLTRVGQDDLSDVPAAEEARRKLLERALGFYREFAQQRADDPRLALQVAHAERRVGSILLLLGRNTEARAELEHALDAYESWGGARGTPEIRSAVSETRANLADALRLGGGAEAADAIVRRSIEDLTPVVAAAGATRDDRIALAMAHRKLADIRKLGGDRAGARAELEEAARLLAVLHERGAVDTDALVTEGGTLARLGQIQMQLGDVDAAQATLASALACLAAVAPASASEAPVRELQSVVGNHYSQVLAARADYAAAREHAGRAVEAAEELDVRFPASPRRRNQLAVNLTTLAAAEANAGDTATATAHFERAWSLLAELCARFPATPTYATQLSGVEVSVVKVLIEARDLDQALARCHDAEERVTRVIEANPGDALAIETREFLRIEESRALLALGRYADVARTIAAISALRGPADVLVVARLAGSCVQLARDDEAGAPEVRGEVSATCRRIALERLRQAAAQGAVQRRGLLSDEALAALRGEPEFQALVDSLPPD